MTAPSCREALEWVANLIDSHLSRINTSPDLRRMRPDIAAALAAPDREAELAAEVERLRGSLERIAGDHWERVGYCQTDVDRVPDLTAEEALSVARAALAREPQP